MKHYAMLDPTLPEMLTTLRSRFYAWENEDDLLIACHTFASRWYLGMGSNLYAAICKIDYDAKDSEPSEDVEEMVSVLESEYTNAR
jgi:hypothetical protein